MAPLPDPAPSTSESRGLHDSRLQPERVDCRKRLLLWADGVGGYLLCLGERVRIGQAVPDTDVEVPLYARVSREHATLGRDGADYWLTAHRPAWRNGRPVEHTPLVEGDRVRLGESLELIFSRPVPGSATALVRFAGQERLPWSVEGVVLWADVVRLGPAADSHVVCPSAEDQVVLFRDGEDLWCRGGEALEVDGHAADQPARLTDSSRVRYGGLSLALEPVG